MSHEQRAINYEQISGSQPEEMKTANSMLHFPLYIIHSTFFINNRNSQLITNEHIRTS